MEQDLEQARVNLQAALDKQRVHAIPGDVLITPGAVARVSEIFGYPRLFIWQLGSREPIVHWTIIPEWADPELAIDRVVLDLDTKDLVRISNGVCRRCQQAIPNHACTMEPYEGIVLRPVDFQPNVGDKRKRPGGEWTLYWTYISVDGHNLSSVEKQTAERFEKMLAAARGRF